MKVLAFNGSPRKNWNTATLLNKALEGAAAQGAETELVHLYDLNYKGCYSCFACKTRGGASYGKCAAKDDLAPILNRVEEADAIILGSPIYYGHVSGEMKSFLERLLFQYNNYDDPWHPLCPKKIRVGLIYTANATEEQMMAGALKVPEEVPEEAGGGSQVISLDEFFLKITFGHLETLISGDTYQFEDYSKMAAGYFDPEKKAQRRKEVFPIDCRKAFELGSRLATLIPQEH